MQAKLDPEARSAEGLGEDRLRLHSQGEADDLLHDGDGDGDGDEILDDADEDSWDEEEEEDEHLDGDAGGIFPDGTHFRTKRAMLTAEASPGVAAMGSVLAWNGTAASAGGVAYGNAINRGVKVAGKKRTAEDFATHEGVATKHEGPYLSVDTHGCQPTERFEREAPRSNPAHTPDANEDDDGVEAAAAAAAAVAAALRQPLRPKTAYMHFEVHERRALCTGTDYVHTHWSEIVEQCWQRMMDTEKSCYHALERADRERCMAEALPPPPQRRRCAQLSRRQATPTPARKSATTEPCESTPRQLLAPPSLLITPPATRESPTVWTYPRAAPPQPGWQPPPRFVLSDHSSGSYQEVSHPAPAVVTRETWGLAPLQQQAFGWQHQQGSAVPPQGRVQSLYSSVLHPQYAEAAAYWPSASEQRAASCGGTAPDAIATPLQYSCASPPQQLSAFGSGAAQVAAAYSDPMQAADGMRSIGTWGTLAER
ncbi:hypothetical protein JKP88DRAFT_267383 [Tribonema minus]|uniref:Uncharacterized protein n=1 Tax=Tribonema minus TaxID=303371 RepID=A0A835ZB91_9STRA|nr:hypothetical protein JKP88DRAFT_267383 [Tribonema minus]